MHICKKSVLFLRGYEFFRINHLSLHPKLRTCSADTILRAISELAQSNISYASDAGKKYAFNTAERLNELMLNCLMATLADAIMDRLVANANKIELKGESMRQRKKNKHICIDKAKPGSWYRLKCYEWYRSQHYVGTTYNATMVPLQRYRQFIDFPFSFQSIS